MQDERVDVNKQETFDGCKPFYVACANGQTEVVKHMIQDQRVDVNKPDKDNRTPIWRASNNNHTQVVQAILQSGRYINLDTKYQNKTPLERARQDGYKEIVNLIENYMKNPVDTRKSEPVSQSKKIKKQQKKK